MDDRRRALVTGASSGIGYALAVELARKGYDVCVSARRREPLEALVAEIAGEGCQANLEVLDVDDTNALVHRLRALDVERPFDLVIANAGVGIPSGVMNASSWEAIGPAFHTNFCGAAATITALIDAMVKRKSGHIVGIGSLASFGPLPQSAAYCAPKAGLSMLLACLQMDLVGTGVAVTDVRLGFVRTPMLARATHAMPQMLEPEDAARRIVRGLQSRPNTLTLPQPFGLVAQLSGLLPNSLRRLVLARSVTRDG
jgi:short-subunit dehydrogenase